MNFSLVPMIHVICKLQ